jgi:hypothetical protein
MGVAPLDCAYLCVFECICQSLRKEKSPGGQTDGRTELQGRITKLGLEQQRSVSTSQTISTFVNSYNKSKLFLAVKHNVLPPTTVVNKDINSFGGNLDSKTNKQ